MVFTPLNFESLQGTFEHMPETDEWQIRRYQRSSARHQSDHAAIHHDSHRKSMLAKPIRKVGELQHKYASWAVLVKMLDIELISAVEVSAKPSI